MIVESLISLGVLFLAVGAIGLVRFETVFSRMHAASAATTLGTGMIVIATAVDFYPDPTWLSTLVVTVFLFITAPTGAHLIARAIDIQQFREE
ncbi:monovalent cation/H(+) antiporter subunit G [Candidatus Nanohalococcus occultus]|uniref:Multicomponent Na:H antiporter subunit G n=1 Tax=Candidatus Nanohalococcus occultus TaxID=2978047 RepID=A0ABY8CJM7_9ARCH|nr:Multicomponent Na :H antiporter subunit G [Candidatus Nanohaloarchaeota archaeon SVXNc]